MTVVPVDKVEDVLEYALVDFNIKKPDAEPPSPPPAA
jgi:hypothetical protein